MGTIIDSDIVAASRNEQWDIVRKKLLKKLRKDPTNGILLTYLSNAYCAEEKYKEALKYSSKAISYLPQHPLVLWDYARSLYLNREFSMSIATYKKIRDKSPSSISKSMSWDIEYTKKFWNSTRFDIALCYIQLDKLGLAVKALESYLSHIPECGIYYLSKLAKDKIKKIQRLQKQTRNKTPRIWMALIEVKVTSTKKSIKCKKGFTNGLVLAKTTRNATQLLKKELANLGYELVGIEDITEYERELLKTELKDDFMKLAVEAKKTKQPKFTDFCMYKVKST